VKERVDVLVVAALAVERNALLRHVSSPYKRIDGNVESYLCELKVNSIHSISVLVVASQKAGNVYAAACVKSILEHWDPVVVVSFGIAGGIESKDPQKLDRVRLGDIIFGDIVFYYEHLTEASSVETRDWFPHLECDNSLKSFVWEYYENPINEDNTDSWQSKIRVHRPGTEGPEDGGVSAKVLTGAIASGEKVIRSTKGPSRKRAIRNYAKIRVFEMEAFGVGVAANGYISRKLRFVAIKGVADYAGGDKGDLWHDYSTDSAAAFLFHMLASYTRKEASQGRAAFEWLGTESPAADRASQQALHFSQVIPPHYVETIKIAELKRPLAEGPVSVFYHWRALHQHVHWVDFCFLLILNRISQGGHKIGLAVTDRIHENPVADVRSSDDLQRSRASTSYIVERVLGNRAELLWFTEIEIHRAAFEDHARTGGLRGRGERELDTIIHSFGRSEGNHVVKTWVEFIAWYVRRNRRCIILEWKRHVEMWQQITHYLSLNAAVIPTADLKLGDTLGKVDLPGRNLVINPPDFPEIMHWLLEEDSVERLRAFWWYITLKEGEIGSYLERQRTQGFLEPEALVKLASGHQLALCSPLEEPSDLDRYRLGIAASLLEWNRDYFNDARRD